MMTDRHPGVLTDGSEHHDAPAMARRAAQQILACLGDGPQGVVLLGAAQDTAEVIGCLLPLLDGQGLRAVGLQASSATPALLRARVGAAHAARPDRATRILLVLSQAQAASPDLLHELDLAAEAASIHGGLAFLLAGTDPLPPLFAAANTYGLETACPHLVDLRDTMAAESAPDPSRGIDVVAGALAAGAPAIALVGPVAETSDMVRRLLARCASARLLPARLSAATATPDGLRAAASRAHDARPDAGCGVLLVIEDAEALSAAMIAELEQAAEAALRFGGLQILLAGTVDPGPRLAAAGLPTLPAVLWRLRCQGADAPAPVLSFAPRPGRWRRYPAPVGLAAAAGFAGLTLTALMPAGLLPHWPGRPAGHADNPHPAPQTRLAAVIQPPPLTQTPLPSPAPAPAPAPAGASLLLLAQPGDTLRALYRAVYRGADAPPYAQIAAMNPVLRPGTRLVFPSPSGGWPKP